MPCIFNNGRSHVKINYVLQIIYYYSVYYLCLFAWCPTHSELCFCFVFLHLVYPMLPCYSGFSIFDCPIRFSLTFIFVLRLVCLIFPITQDFLFLIAPSVFSNVYFGLVYLLLPIILDFLFLIAPSVFSNVYLPCVLCTQCCQCLRIVYYWLHLRFSLTFICPVYCVPNVASVSGLSIVDYTFGFL